MNDAIVGQTDDLNNDVPLIESVPNFSEGRRQWVIDLIADAIRQSDAHLLHVSSDVDHHRTVMTLAGTPDAVTGAMLAAARVAVQHIDLEKHTGQHPRMGAVDVVPFVPLRNCTLTDCAAWARAFGERAAAELELPVYLYGAAALRPERENLADVRRGGYEGLKTAITQPERAPDYGSAHVGSAGAMIVGAREPLIAFNISLNTHDVAIAQAIAWAIRESGGGLPQVKALGLLVNGRAQVSMNLTNYRVTPLWQVVHAVEQAAAAYRVSIHGSEVVGLIPENALLDSALHLLHLPPEARALILERHIGRATGDYRPLFE